MVVSRCRLSSTTFNLNSAVYCLRFFSMGSNTFHFGPFPCSSVHYTRYWTQLHSFDIIVGNPPWGFEEGMTAIMRESQKQVQSWCEVYGWSIGDKEFSQAFIARTLSLLKVGGQCGFLVSTGIFFKHHENSQRFRQRWLEECTIKTVVNFVHVRHSFFNAVAPFAFVHYEASPADLYHRIHYWSVKKTEIIDRVQAVILT